MLQRLISAEVVLSHCLRRYPANVLKEVSCSGVPVACLLMLGQEFLSLGDGSTKHRIFIHYLGWSSNRWDSWVDARCRCVPLTAFDFLYKHARCPS